MIGFTGETMETSTLEERFLMAINREEEIIFISYSLLDDTEEKIKFVLAKILEKHQKEELFTPLYSCIKELIANANKANAKQILTDEGTIEDPENIIEVIEKVRTILNEKSQLEYGLKAKQKMLSTRTYLRDHNGVLTIRIINNLALPEKELKRISERIEKSSHYDSIAEIYIEDPDPYAEGMGLGLSMVVVLLKSVGVDHENFTVSTDSTGKTYAEMNIPLV
ncbi:MAG TPA: hypothetical protein PK200_16820 [Spirochaetota bacterium]|nr:hypothetical protein [Spirochaetota bacterium]